MGVESSDVLERDKEDWTSARYAKHTAVQESWLVTDRQQLYY